MAKKQDPLKLIKQLGEELYNLRKSITDAEEAARLAIAPLKEEKEAKQALLIDAFKKAGVSSIRVQAGDTVAMVSRQSYAVLNPISALFWAKDNGAVRIDSIMLKQRLEKADPATLPEGVFQAVTEEYISVRKPKAPKATEEADKV